MKKARPGIYRAIGADGFELCQPTDNADYERINVDVGGTPRKSSWKPFSVRLIHEDEGKLLTTSDSPWLGYGPLIFRPSVMEALGPTLLEYGELLPLTCSEAELMLYNPLRLLDALDEEASSVMRFADGRIMLVRKHVFRSDVVCDNDIFTTPEDRVRPTFFSHRFVDRWNASGLKGLVFNQLWASPT